MFINDREIQQYVEAGNLISPFKGYQEANHNERPSSGQSCCGYDLTLGYQFKSLQTELEQGLINNDFIIDPRNPPKENEYTVWDLDPNPTNNTYFVLPPKSFVLAHAAENIKMVENLVGFVMDKSSLARLGLLLFNTVIEPSWEGIITLEIFNCNIYPIKLYPGMGCCQIMFAKINRPLKTYPEKSKGGKYQHQIGVTVAL